MIFTDMLLVILLHLFDFTFKIISILCTGHIFPTPSEGITITSLSTIFDFK